MEVASKTGRVLKFVGQKGKTFRLEVEKLVMQYKDFFNKEERLEVCMYLCPPDRRRRDVDNYSKALLDALQNSGVYHDDCQIDGLNIYRCQDVLYKKTGRIFLTISVVDQESWLKSKSWKKVIKLCKI